MLATTDSKWLGNYMQKVVASEDVAGAENVNEFYRKNFRKVSSAQALDVVNALAEGGNGSKVACLDNQFWVWESLEEALRGEVDSLCEEDYRNVVTVFAANFKGSSDFIDLLEYKLYNLSEKV